MAIGNYVATGEGHTTVVAMAATEARAKTLAYKVADEMFLSVVCAIADLPEPYRNMLDPVMLDIRERYGDGNLIGEYVMYRHYNLS